jgi:hypothetical protein
MIMLMSFCVLNLMGFLSQREEEVLFVI